jgi:hypothetical protein
MPDSRPPQRNPAPVEPDLFRRAAELVAETHRLVAKTHRLVAQSRALIRWSQELRGVAQSLCDSNGRPGAVTPARPPARSR